MWIRPWLAPNLSLEPERNGPRLHRQEARDVFGLLGAVIHHLAGVVCPSAGCPVVRPGDVGNVSKRERREGGTRDRSCSELIVSPLRGSRSRLMMLGLAGEASRSTERGTWRAAYQSASATTTTSSSGPMTGRNSGTRSMGDSSQRKTNPTATLARRGTLGSARSRRTAVAQASRKPVRSLSIPSGSRATVTTSSASGSPTRLTDS